MPNSSLRAKQHSRDFRRANPNAPASDSTHQVSLANTGYDCIPPLRRPACAQATARQCEAQFRDRSFLWKKFVASREVANARSATAAGTFCALSGSQRNRF